MLVIPLVLRLRLVVAVAEEEFVLMAHASTGDVGPVLVQAAPRPPRACRPPGTAIAFGHRCC